MDLRGFVDITEVPRLDLVKAVYAASRPQGMGYLHFTEGPLDDATANHILESGDKYFKGGISMDYVHGRACKFHMQVKDGHHYARLDWFDHTPEQFKEVLRNLNLPDAEARFAEAEKGDAELKAEWEEEKKQRAAR